MTDSTVRGIVVVGLLLITMCGSLAADEIESSPWLRRSVATAVSPLEDDANLHTVKFVGLQTGWAVGDRGVIWKTTDGGRAWSLQKSPVNCPLFSLCFLTDRVGWIAGGGTLPYSRIGFGVLLYTEDGGRHWRIITAHRQGLRNPTQVLRERQTEMLQQQRRTGRRRGPVLKPWPRLPRLRFVKFFGLKRGIAVGEASDDFPSGLMTTEDGGHHWKPIPGRRQNGWRISAFIRPDVGIVAGLRGKLSLVGNGRLLKPALQDVGLRTLQGVSLLRDGTGWLVGDGGLVLRTTNGGIVWKSPAAQMPKALRDITDFRAVASLGRNVWIAGRPGSVIWHSADGGRSWHKQFTGQSVPVNAVSFPTDKIGVAVGALGTILRTGDGGTTWQAMRGGNRRIAILSIHARPRDISFNLLAKQSGDLGYRSLVMLPTRWDVGPDGHSASALDLAFPEAVIAAGGSGGVIGWQFPVAVPGLDRNERKLLADWTIRAEGRLREVFVGRFVSQIRTWRPSLIVIDEPSKEDALTKLLNDALTQAVPLAADPTAFIHQSELAGLKPWSVKKIYWRLPPGSTGHDHVAPYEYLPRLRATVQFSGEKGARLLRSASILTSGRESFRLIYDRTQNKSEQTVNRAFFTGIPLSPGSAARRKLLPWNDNDDANRKRANRQRNFQAYAARFLHDPRHAAQLIAQLHDVTSGMDAEWAALQLLQLVNDYKRRAQWELAEAATIELVSRHPGTSAGKEGMRWLFQLWTGAEPVWQRLRQIHSGRQRIRYDVSTLRDRLSRAKQLARLPVSSRDISTLDVGADPVQFATAADSFPLDRNDERRAKGARHWSNQALWLASLMRKTAPELYRSAEIQFPLAALLRSRGNVRMADRTYRRFLRAGGDGLWKQTARNEIWTIAPHGESVKPILYCRPTNIRPVLDGVLSDPCWEAAKAVRLTSPKSMSSWGKSTPFVMMSYDSAYLYLAGSFPRVPGMPLTKPIHKGRRHDADLSKFDRLSLFLDLDRDYATYYALQIDQRGLSADSCFQNKSWNPRWVLAVDGDEKSWQFEAAIPWKELTPRPPRRGTVWAAGLVRTLPAIGLQSWTHPTGSKPRPESFGLIQFE